MIEKEPFLQFIETSLDQVQKHKIIASSCDADEIVIELHDKVLNHFESIKTLLIQKDIPINYINQFYNELNQILNLFPYRMHQLDIVQNNNKVNLLLNIQSNSLNLARQINQFDFILDFFTKLNYFSDNVVAIGANGSGKTTLSNELKKYLPNTGVVISAQKVLIVPTFGGISNFESTFQRLKDSQTADKSLKVTYATENDGNSWSIMTKLGGEFKVLLDNLLSERSVERNKFVDAFQKSGQAGIPPVTKLDKALNIWNSLIQHRILECTDGINITLKTSLNATPYPAHQMSDGEKVILYLIAHVLQAPKSGFIIVDEPEMYLHKTILNKLWDILENERQDCIFIYLTHDLDFATSRTTAKKVWIKSFTHPNSWEIEHIPDNELPEALLMELLGSRKNILFCEGKKGSIDEKIYNILFPNFTITPVDSCLDVIAYTKAFNRLPNILTKAMGLIDSDYHNKERLSALKEQNIFSFAVAEAENLLLDESFLEVMAKQLLKDEMTVEQIKSDIIRQLQTDTELQAANYVASKINYYFKDSHVSRGNTIGIVETNFTNFTSEIKIHEWHDERVIKINELIHQKDYAGVISIFNNKGLKSHVQRSLKISDFTERAIKMLQFHSETHQLLNKYFPTEIVNGNYKYFN